MTPPDQRGQQDPIDKVNTITKWLIAALALGTSAMKVVIIAPAINKTATDGMDQVALYSSWIGIEVLWLWSLLWEWMHLYHRPMARTARRYRWIALALYFPIVIAVDWDNKNPRNSLTALFIVGMFLMAWKAWMHLHTLPPEDQKIVDEIVEKQEELLHQRFQEDVKRRRDARLQAAINRVTRFSTPSALVETAAERDLPATTWSIPNRRHDPIVYFLRNGNRIKIGTTTDLRQRIRRLSLRPEDIALLLPGDRATEQQLHRTFANLRVGNTEWFHLAEPLTTFIAEKVASRTDNGFPTR